MRNFLRLITITCCALLLVGCSSSTSEIHWDDGVISVDGNVINVDKFTGDTATKVTEEYTATFYKCVDFDSCPHNTLTILEEDMTSYKDKSMYFAIYNGTQINLYYPAEDENYDEGKLETDESATMDPARAAEILYSVLKYKPLSYDYEKVICNDLVALNVSYYSFEARADAVVIPGMIKISVNTAPVACNELVTVGETSVAKGSSEKYDYYQYRGLLIQVPKGTDLTGLVEFLGD